jgi:hypothetical protein
MGRTGTPPVGDAEQQAENALRVTRGAFIPPSIRRFRNSAPGRSERGVGYRALPEIGGTGPCGGRALMPKAGDSPRLPLFSS